MERYFISARISQDKLRDLVIMMGRYYSKDDELKFGDCLKIVTDKIYKSLLMDLSSVIEEKQKVDRIKRKKKKISKEEEYVSRNQIRRFINPKRVLFVTKYRCVKIPYNAHLIFKKIMNIIMADSNLLALCRTKYFRDGCCCRTVLLDDYYQKIKDLAQKETDGGSNFFFRRNKKTEKIEGKVTHVLLEFQKIVNLSCINHEN